MTIASEASAKVVDLIYESALVPEKWPAALDQVSAMTGSVGGALLATGDRHPPRWAASETIAPALRAYTAGDAWKENKRPQQVLCSVGTGFSRDVDLWTPEELESYRISDERSQHDLGWQLGSIIPMSSGDTVIFTFDRRFDDGPHDVPMRDAADSLRPHLARAGLLAARLGLERAQTMVATLAAIGLPAAVLTGAGRVVAVNELLQGMTSLFLPAAHGALAVTNSNANTLLQRAIVEYEQRDFPVRSIPVPATDERGAAVIHLLPVRGAAQDLFTRAEILVVVTAVGVNSASPSLSLLHGLFDLSPAEARLAAALAAGEALKAAAVNQGIQFSTARSYLEAVFRKTGTHQQSQLVALLKSAQPFATQP
ncbi:MAG: helix-turn-helix transcriptional regulator [Pseudomonadota bacterium]